ncbi:MAG: hypothetical protein HGB32_16520 [Geobacteraceae bacterium]|nr:hypothetical protein [Geobacteraceae bacterium]NTW81723.1 hypothetical protein [Geobacteraceae bacterium]
MKKCIFMLLALVFGFVFSPGVGSSDCYAEESPVSVDSQKGAAPILFSHHVGNRPDDAPDIDDVVHGGDYDPDDPYPWDPTNPDAPPEPGGNSDGGGQPDAPGNGGQLGSDK